MPMLKFFIQSKHMTDHSVTIQRLFESQKFPEVISFSLENSISPLTDPGSSLIVAASYFRLGNFSKSFEFLNSLEPFFPENSEYLSLYAATSRRLGDYSKASELFLKALRISPESKEIKNNYANLLIDLKKFTEAHEILDKLISDHPSYQDALTNMARLKSLVELASDSKQDYSSIQASNDSQVSNTLDPLMLAFTEEEVQRFKKSVSTNTNTPTLETNSLQKGLPNMTAESVAQDQLKLANQAVIDGNPMFALSLCEKALPHLPASSALYDCACDACISLEKFDKAELYALHSIITGQPSFKNYFNLASFAVCEMICLWLSTISLRLLLLIQVMSS